MPGIRISGRPADPAQGADLSGFNLGQLQAMESGSFSAMLGGSSSGSPMAQWQAAHAQKNTPNINYSPALGFSPTGQFSAWNQSSRGSFADARAINSNYDAISRTQRLMAEHENRNRDAVYSQTYRMANYENRDRDSAYRVTRMTAEYENRNRDAVMAQTRREADYENRDRQLADTKRRRQMDELRREAEYENRERDIAAARRADEDRRMADYENRDRDLAYDKMRREADYENRDFDARSRPPGGGGGRRGGGGGGGGGGWGGGGRGGVPFAGLVGLGTSSRLLTRGLGTALAADLIEELFFLPQSIGGAESGALGSSDMARKFRSSAYAMGRAGGFGGQGLADSLYSGVRPPAWMQSLGLGPTEAMQMLTEFGIVQPSVGASTDLIRGLAGTRFTPAFSGLNMEGSIGLAARSGMIAPNAGGVQAYAQQMAPILEMAVERGLDRASVLRSIDAGITTAVHGGGGLGMTAGGIGGFISQYSSLPGGRTGEAGLDAAQRLQAATGTVGQDGLRTQLFIQKAAQLKDPASLRTFLNNGQTGFYENFASSDAGQKLLQDYFDAQKAGDSVAAGLLLSKIVMGGGDGGIGNAGAERDVLTNNSIVRQHPRYWRSLIGTSGLTPSQIVTGDPSRPNLSSAMYDRYRGAGMTPAAASAMVGYANAESGFNPYQVSNEGGGQGAHGLLQLRGQRLVNYRRIYGHDPADPSIPADQLAQEAADFSLREMSDPTLDAGAFSAGWSLRSENNPDRASDIVSSRYGRGNYSPAELARRRGLTRGALQQYGGRNIAENSNVPVESPPGSPGSNVPADDLKGQANAFAGVMMSSMTSLKEMNAVVPPLNHAIDVTTTTFQKLVIETEKLIKQINKLHESVTNIPPAPYGMGLGR